MKHNILLDQIRLIDISGTYLFEDDGRIYIFNSVTRTFEIEQENPPKYYLSTWDLRYDHGDSPLWSFDLYKVRYDRDNVEMKDTNILGVDYCCSSISIKATINEVEIFISQSDLKTG